VPAVKSSCMVQQTKMNQLMAARNKPEEQQLGTELTQLTVGVPCALCIRFRPGMARQCGLRSSVHMHRQVA
jgi:hypothetical protein